MSKGFRHVQVLDRREDHHRTYWKATNFRSMDEAEDYKSYIMSARGYDPSVEIRVENGRIVAICQQYNTCE